MAIKSWLVVRDCCLHGNCDWCHKSASRPQRIIHYCGSERQATIIARNWRGFNATVEEAPDDTPALRDIMQEER